MILHSFTNHTNGARTLRINLSNSSVIARNVEDEAVYCVVIDVRIPSCCAGVVLQNCAAQRVSSNAVDLPVHERDIDVADLGFNDRQSVEETLFIGVRIDPIRTFSRENSRAASSGSVSRCINSVSDSHGDHD
jgi:hypothetical protein